MLTDRIPFVVLLFFLTSLFLGAQEMPPIQIYSPKTYGAETQNWSISQSQEKYIYVANNKGLLEFNGSEWRLYQSPNETIMRSVNVIGNRIYTGCNREFGYWERNELGELVYTSLSETLGVSFLEDEEFWNIIALDDWILFQSLKRIYLYNKKDSSYSIVDSETTIYKMFKVNGGIYFQKTKDGIYKIENGESKLIASQSIVKNNLIVNIFSHKEGLLIETENNGFFVLNDRGLTKWKVPGNDILSKISVYRSIQLRDNSFILGTRSKGIIHLSSEGEFNYNINIINGLSNNTIHSVFEDVESNIWLALDNGINCINVKSPFSIFNDKAGKIGTVYASAVFNDNLYLGSNQGLFYKPLKSSEDFMFLEETQGPAWCLVELDNTLFCGNDSGTFIVNDNTVEKISDIRGTWNIIPIPGKNNMLLQGNYDGLYVLKKRNDKWTVINKIEGFDNSSKFFEIANTNEILVSHEYKGIFNIKINKDYTKAIQITQDTIKKNRSHSSIIKYNNELLYTYKKGVFKYDSGKRIFHRDPVLSGLFTQADYTSGKLVADNKNNILWGFSDKNLNYISPGKLSNIPKINRISFSEALPKGLTGYENIFHLKDQKYLMGTSKGYIIIDLEKISIRDFKVEINSIIKSDLNGSAQMLDKTTKGEFKNKDNNIEFNMGVAEFDKYLDTNFQYRLEGIYDQWSNWSSNSRALFKNLPYGDYTFNVRAKVGNEITENVASYSFKIQRPWYLTNTLITIYIFFILLFSLLMHNIYKRYYKKQREKLMLKNKRELVLKELENQQQLMRFNNEKLRQDIENKNRELGISTMSLIKKNEFLNNIKKELNTAEEGKNLKHIIKIIDRNLNNTDDWNVFQKAFNNADKDFLKKIKAEHPLLTSSDLRLCAYLRLNLSSKEIAPLLNISARSVEVKRYRLRKKMNLPHECSLSNYILEL